MQRLINEIFVRRKIVILLFVLLLGYGIYSYFVIPKQEMPELDTPYMVISITAPSVSASDMEVEIISDIEKAIDTFDEVTDINSTIYDNFAYILVTFSYSTVNPTEVSSDIFSRINDLALSPLISDITYTSNFDNPHIIYALHSVDLTENQLMSEANTFKNKLILLDEIKDISIDNAFQEELVILLDSSKLQLYNLTISDIYTILIANSINIPLGGLQTDEGTISVSGYPDINSIEDLENMIIIPEIPTVSPAITLGDISAISIQNTSNKSYSFNGNNAVFLSIYFKKNIDYTKMDDEVNTIKSAFLNDINSTVKVDEMLFLPQYVEEQINDVFYSLLMAIGIVLVVVLIGIGFRNSLLIVITIPIIIFGTIGILYLSNFELHKLTIVGLIVAIGILVDNSIVITEGIKRNIELGFSKIEGAKKAILDNSGPVLSSTLTTIAAFIVIVLLPGFLGKIVSSMPLTVIIAISLSYLVSMILSPIIATMFLKSKPSDKKSRISIHEINIKKMIGFTIKYPLFWIAGSIALFAFSVYFAFRVLPLDLYPNDQRSVLYIDYENPIVGDFTSTHDLENQIISLIDNNPHLLNYASSVGGDLPSFHFSAKFMNETVQNGRIYLNFDYTETELMTYKSELEELLQTDITAKIQVNTLELSPPVPPLRVTLSSKNSSDLDQLSDDIFNDIINLDSVKAYSITRNFKSSKIIVHYNTEVISSSFLTKAEVSTVIATNLNGFSQTTNDPNSDDLSVRLITDINSIEDVLSLTIYSSQLDTYIPMSSLITLEIIEDYVIINRLNNKNTAFIDLYFVDGYKLDTFESEVKEIIDNKDIGNVIVTYSGENSMFEEISGDLIRASIFAIILIYIVMFIQFNNFIKPLIVYVTIPLSFTGSFLFLLLFRSPITATSLIGMVSLIGVTVNTGILLVEYITRAQNSGSSVKDACIESVYLRFRPIILTSATTILGLIPLLITGGNFFRPLAITFMGGMITSTILTIFLVPSVYYLIYKKS